ncbi:MAG: DUF2796 domain-containing protein [Stenotrophomonas sp.]
MKPSAILLLLSAVPAAHAHDVRHHDAHVHGQATVDVAVDNGIVELALRAPGIGILDFERPPANDSEQAALQRARAILKGGAWVSLPTAAQCRLQNAVASADGFAATATTATAANAEPNPHAHAGFTAALHYRCANPAALRALVIPLPTLFPGLHEVIVNTAAASGQGRSVVTADNLRIPLAP